MTTNPITFPAATRYRDEHGCIIAPQAVADRITAALARGHAVEVDNRDANGCRRFDGFKLVYRAGEGRPAYREEAFAVVA